jgi:ribose 5-phosphate isomerase B
MSNPHTLFIAADHAGYTLKEKLIEVASLAGWQVRDLGTLSEESVDYPDFAVLVAQSLRQYPEALGVLACGTGIGMSIAANRFPHIRAALCHTEFEAEVARAHNNANILCLGGRVIGGELAQRILLTFLRTSFEGGRHQERLAKISPCV